jgi:hypothetical protein
MHDTTAVLLALVSLVMVAGAVLFVLGLCVSAGRADRAIERHEREVRDGGGWRL